MEFLTIDFETASRYEYSPCAVSIYSFNDGTKHQLLSTLINPGNVYFQPKLVKLHGITEEDVKNAPKIQNVLRDICNIISNKFIFAHNAGFDISRIIQGCDIYDIQVPNFKYADSLMVAKRTWNGLINYKLDTICDYLNIPLNHHNADSDSVACGQIILKALDFHKVTSIDSLLNIIKYEYGYCVNEEFYSAHSLNISTKHKRKRENKNTKSDYDKVKEVEIKHNIDSLLNEKVIVFTGSLSITRQEAMQLAASSGAIPAASVTKSTNYLVVGNDDYGNFKLGNKSNKMIKAEELISEGQDLEMIDEDTFFELLSKNMENNMENFKEEIFEIIENAIKETSIEGFNIYNECSVSEKLSYVENKDMSISYKVLNNYILLKYYPMKKVNDRIEIHKFDDILPALEGKFPNIQYISDDNYFRIEINDFHDIQNISEILSSIFSKLFLQYISNEESFACCSQYLSCSDAKHCVNNNIRSRMGCIYKNNLDKGKIFYGKNKTIQD